MLAGYEHVVTPAHRHGKKIGSETALQVFPGCAAVIGPENDSALSYSVTSLSVGKGDSIKPFLQILINAFPRLAGVLGAQDRSLGADGNSMLLIHEAHVLKPAESVCVLKVPG